MSDHSRSIISRNTSPDIPFDVSLNPYRGCEHGCAYCYARPTHEYLGYSAGLDFETRILVKHDAARLLEESLRARTWQPQVLAMSGVTDPYQPVEKTARITRGCLEVLAAFRNPVTVITKNALVARDLDLLQELARHRAAAVCLSIPTLDHGLSGELEPRTTRPWRRLQAVRQLADAGIPVGVLVAPVIPGLTDHEVPAVVAAAAEAGASFAGYVVLRLPLAVGPVFDRWLQEHRPQRRDKVLNRVRALREGALNDSRFGSRMRGEGEFARMVQMLFTKACHAAGLQHRRAWLSTDAFQVPGGQLSLL